MEIEQPTAVLTIVSTIVPAVAPGVIAVAGFMGRKWHEDRDIEKRHREALTQAEHELEIWAKWRDMTIEVADKSDIPWVANHLHTTCKRIMQELNHANTLYVAEKSRPSRSILRDLFLIDCKATARVWIARITYYILTVFTICIAVESLRTPTISNSPEAGALTGQILGEAIALALFFLPSALLWWITKTLQQRAMRQDQLDEETSAQAPPSRTDWVDLRGHRPSTLQRFDSSQQGGRRTSLPSTGRHTQSR